MNKSIKKYLLLLIAVFMAGESRPSENLSNYFGDIRVPGSERYDNCETFDALLAARKSDNRRYGYDKAEKGSEFNLVCDGRFAELKELWASMKKNEQDSIFFRCEKFGNIFHYAAQVGRFDILKWLIEELCLSFAGNRNSTSELSFQQFFNRKIISKGSKVDLKSLWWSQHYTKDSCPENVLNYVYFWNDKCRTEKDFQDYKKCIELLLQHGGFFCTTRSHFGCKWSRELDGLGLYLRNNTDCKDQINHRIKYILSRVDQMRAQRITANRVQMFKRFAGAFILCAVAYKINLAQRVKSLIAGGFNFIGHRALAAGEALSH